MWKSWAWRRSAALVLNRALIRAEEMAREGTRIEALEAAIRAMIEAEPRAALRGLDIVHPESLAPLEGALEAPAAILLSAEFGGILLIDQRVVSP